MFVCVYDGQKPAAKPSLSLESGVPNPAQLQTKQEKKTKEIQQTPYRSQPSLYPVKRLWTSVPMMIVLRRNRNLLLHDNAPKPRPHRAHIPNTHLSTALPHPNRTHLNIPIPLLNDILLALIIERQIRRDMVRAVLPSLSIPA